MNLSDLLRHVPKLEILKLLPPPDKAEVTHVDITTWNVDLLIEYALVGARIPSTYLVYMISRCKEILVGEPNLVSITTEKPVYIIGDIHGSFHDMLQIFEQTGLPNEDSYFIFLGDIINRGFYGIECLTLILLFKVKYPHNVIIIRGNHESRGSTQVYGFFQECVSKYGSGREDRGLILPPPPLRPYSLPSSSPSSRDKRPTTFLSPSPSTYLHVDPLARPLSVSALSDTSSASLPPPPSIPSISPSILSLPLGDHPEGPTLYKHFISMFDALPIAVVVHNTIFCVHGGLSPNIQRLSDIHRIDRFVEVPAHGPLSDLLWSDPDDSISQYYRNARGNGVTFGRNIVSDFLTQNSLSVIVRSHQLAYQGVSVACERVMTVWSAPNYCGRFHNKACFLRVAPHATSTNSNASNPAIASTTTNTTSDAAAASTITAAAAVLATAVAASVSISADNRDETHGDISDGKGDNEGENTCHAVSDGRVDGEDGIIVESTLNTHPIATSTVAAHTTTTPLAHTSAPAPPATSTTAATTASTASTTNASAATTAASAGASAGISSGASTGACSGMASQSFPPLPTHLSFSLLPIPTCPSPLRSRMLELASEASKRLLASVYVATHPYRHLAGVAYGSECTDVSCGAGSSGGGASCDEGGDRPANGAAGNGSGNGNAGTGTGMRDDTVQRTTGSEASSSNGGSGARDSNHMSDEDNVGVNSARTERDPSNRTSTSTHADTEYVSETTNSESGNVAKSENPEKSSFSSPFEAAVMMIRQYFDAPTINLPAFTNTTATAPATTPVFVAAVPVSTAVTTPPTANTANTPVNTHTHTTSTLSTAVDAHPPLLVSLDPVAVASAPVPLHTPPPLTCPSPSLALSAAAMHSPSASPSASSSSSSSSVLSPSSSTSSWVLSVGQPTPIPLHFPHRAPTHTHTNDAGNNDSGTRVHSTTSTTTATTGNNATATCVRTDATATAATNTAAGPDTTTATGTAGGAGSTAVVTEFTSATAAADRVQSTDTTTTTTATIPAKIPTTTILATDPTHAHTHAHGHLPRPPPPPITISPQLSAVLSTSTNTVLSDIPPALSSALPSLLPPALSTALTPRDFGPGSLHGRGILPGAGVVHGAAHNPALVHPSAYGMGPGPGTGMGVGTGVWMCAGGVSPHHPHSVSRTTICLPRPTSHSVPAPHTTTTNTTTTSAAGAMAAVASCASTTSTPLCSPRSSHARLSTPHAPTRVNYPPLRFARSGSGLNAVSGGVSDSGSGNGGGRSDDAMPSAGGSVHASPSHAAHAAVGTNAVDMGAIRMHRGVPVPAGVARYGSRGGGPHPHMSAAYMSTPVPVPVPMTREQHAANIREQHRLAILAYQQGPKPPPRRFGRGSNNISDVVAKGVVASGGLVHGATNTQTAASSGGSSGGSGSGEDHVMARVGAGEIAGGAATGARVEEERKEGRDASSEETKCETDDNSPGSCGQGGRQGEGAENGQTISGGEGTDGRARCQAGGGKMRTEPKKRKEEGEAGLEEGEGNDVTPLEDSAYGALIKRMRVEDSRHSAE